MESEINERELRLEESRVQFLNSIARAITALVDIENRRVMVEEKRLRLEESRVNSSVTQPSQHCTTMHLFILSYCSINSRSSSQP